MWWWGKEEEGRRGGQESSGMGDVDKRKVNCREEMGYEVKGGIGGRERGRRDRRGGVEIVIFRAGAGIRGTQESRGLGDVCKGQGLG